MSSYKITVKDETGNVLPGATVLFRGAGGYGNVSVPVSAAGVVTFDSDAAQWQGVTDADTTITASAPGFQSLIVSGNALQLDNDFVLVKQTPMQSMLPVLGLGALLTAGAYQVMKGKKKVAGIDIKNDVLPYVIPAALLIGGYLVISKISAGLGLTQSPEDKARAAALAASIANAGSPTMSAAEIATTANALKEDLGYSAISNNTADAAHQLTKVSNTADLLSLIQAYGTHAITFLGIPTGTYTLEETVTRQMSSDDIDQINQYYEAQGINFKF